MHYEQAPRICNSDSQVKPLQNMCVSESAIVLPRKPLPADEMLGPVYCMRARDVEKARPGFTNMVSNVPLFSVH